MPYIKSERRTAILHKGEMPKNAGELNYALTLVIAEYLGHHGQSYQTMNDIVGALDNCKDEFRRRIQHPYENGKCAENGDVFT